MPVISDLARLFRAVGAGEVQMAQQIADTIAHAEEQKGRPGAAQRLRGALRPNQPRYVPAVNISRDLATVASGALESCVTQVPLASVTLEPGSRAELESVVEEWRRRDDLDAAGVPRRTRLLFHGPPGCGKSHTARAVAHEAGLPAYTVRFDAIIGSYLGQTAGRLRDLFRFVASAPSVLIIDEVDALGRRRGSPQDVGELDRIVIALLQELEHTRIPGLVVATTNAAEQLDPALWRRFDLALQFPQPKSATLLSFLKRRAEERHVRPAAATLRAARKARSYADADALVETELRRQILSRPRGQ